MQAAGDGAAEVEAVVQRSARAPGVVAKLLDSSELSSRAQVRNMNFGWLLVFSGLDSSWWLSSHSEVVGLLVFSGLDSSWWLSGHSEVVD